MRADMSHNMRYLCAYLRHALGPRTGSTRILSSSTLRVDFTACVGLYKDFILQTATSSADQPLLIAGLGTGGRGGGRGGRGGGRGGRGYRGGRGGGGNNIPVPIVCDDRFYSREEYRALSPGNRVYLRHIRDKRKKEGSEDENPNKRMRASEGTEFSRSLSVLASAVDKLEMASAPVAAIAPTAAPVVNNSTNSALQRIETRQKHKSD